jgi:exodeoxyribonuclease V alpha subunit
MVIPILTQHYILLQRNLVYTEVTRGKKLVVIIGTKRRWLSRSGTTRPNRDTRC